MGLSKKDKKRIIQFCEENDIDYQNGWHNFTSSVPLPNAMVLNIKTEEQVAKLAKLILKLNQDSGISNTITYRPIGAGENKDQRDDRYDRQSYSMTPIMQADILLRLVGPQFHKIKMVDSKNHIVNVGVSIQVGDLDKRLCVDHELCLGTSSLIPYVTIGGLVATGGHGTGRDQPSVAGLVQSMRIVGPDGEITMVDKTHPDFEKIRGAHLGLYGIVLSMDMQCEPARNIKLTIESCNIYEYLEKVKKGLYRNNKYVSVAYFADGEEDEGAKHGSKDVLITYWEPVPLSTPTTGSCRDIETLGQKITIFMQENLSINALLKKHPHLVPMFKQWFVRPLQVAGQDKTIVVPWYDATHAQHAFPHDLDDEDDLFPVSDDCHEIVDAVNHAVKVLNKFAKHDHIPALYALYFRYFKGTNGGLSTSQHGKDQHVFGFDMTSARNMPGFDKFKNEIRHYLMKNYHAKPHHGKTVAADVDYKTVYGKGFDDALDAMKRWHKDRGINLMASPYLNSFFRHHLGLDVMFEQQLEDVIATDRSLALTAATPSTTFALDILQKLEQEFGDDAATKKLLDQLEILTARKRMILSSNSSTRYYTPRPQDTNVGDLVVVPKEKKTKTCGCF